MFHTKATYSGQGSRQQVQRYCDQISNIIKHFLPGCQDVQEILQARVPIIKYSQELIGLDCDLSFATTGYHMSELLYLYGELDNRVRPLVFAVRHWAKERDLVQTIRPTQHFTNFTLTLMVIFFLQNKYKMLPPFNELQKLAHPSKDKYFCEDGVVCSYIRDISGLQPTLNSHWNLQPLLNVDNASQIENSIEPLSITQMLLDFFAFYAKFDYTKGSICVRTGQIQPKRKARDYGGKNGQNNMPHHKVSFDLEVINPLEPELNVSSNVKDKALNLFRKHCQSSLKRMEELQNSPISDQLNLESCSKLLYILDDEDYNPSSKRKTTFQSLSPTSHSPNQFDYQNKSNKEFKKVNDTPNLRKSMKKIINHVSFFDEETSINKEIVSRENKLKGKSDSDINPNPSRLPSDVSKNRISEDADNQIKSLPSTTSRNILTGKSIKDILGDFEEDNVKDIIENRQSVRKDVKRQKRWKNKNVKLKTFFET